MFIFQKMFLSKKYSFSVKCFEFHKTLKGQGQVGEEHSL